jgi:deoxycytidine triphosphate deaminase
MSILYAKQISDLGIIINPSMDCWRTTTYDLRLGEDYVDEGGNQRKLSYHNRDLIIQPHQAITISSHEEVRLPTNIAGRFDLKLKWGLSGLMLQNGTQVEPGYWGKLYTLVFNLSDVPIRLCCQVDRVFAIEFFYLQDKLTALDVEGKIVVEDSQPNRDVTRWLPSHPVKSGLRRLAKEYDGIRNLLYKVIPVTVAIVMTLFAAAMFTFLPNFWSKSVYSKQEIDNIVGTSMQKDVRLQATEARIDSLAKVVLTLKDSLQSLRRTAYGKK